jgi:cysteine desulfurase / selenocysteine lyase
VNERVFDATTIRKDFPVLDRIVHGHPLVYLNSAATAQKPRQVIETLARFYETRNSNVHRGVDTLSEESTDAYEGARERIARFVRADPRGLVFTRNATEALNLVAYAYARTRLGPGDIVLSTEMEHHSNIVPWQLMREAAGYELQFVPITPGGELDREAFDEVVATGRVKLFTVTAMSNVVGTINPVAELAGAVRAANADAMVVVDGAQSVPHMPTDFLALDADALAFSGHKMCGPTGIGCLAAKPELLESMPPFLGGGEMIRDVRLDGTTFNDIPYKFEAGTPAFAEAVGLGAAVDYLSSLGMGAIRAHEVELAGEAIAKLDAVKGVTVHGPKDTARRGAAVSFSVEGIHPHDVGTILDREGVAVRAGHHCAKPLIRALGHAATTRASFYLYNTSEDVDRLVDALEKTKRFFLG